MFMDKTLAETIIDPKAYGDLPRLEAAFAAIRRDAPFAKAAPDNYEPFWVASKHADLLDIERQANIFASGAGPTTPMMTPVRAMVRAFTGEDNMFRSVISVDGEEHKALRAITFPAFTPKAVRQFEGMVRDIARCFVQDLIDRAPECDFARDIAFYYPLRVIMTLLGVSPEDEAHLLRLSQQLFGSSDPEVNRSGETVTAESQGKDLIQILSDMEAYFDGVTTRYRNEPSEAINSMIANAKINGEYLTRRQLMGYYIIAATAGHDTTASATAAAMWALAERPALFSELKGNPDALPAFVDEAIRWASPVKCFMRTAIADGEVRGKPVAKGDWIMLSYHSANRDEEVFDDPYEFRIDRVPNKQVAFGSGPHVCLGQHLARFEMRILWEELLPRLKHVELAGVPKMTEAVLVSGPKSVPIRFAIQ